MAERLLGGQGQPGSEDKSTAQSKTRMEGELVH